MNWKDAMPRLLSAYDESVPRSRLRAWVRRMTAHVRGRDFWDAIVRESAGDAEQKAANVLDVSPHAVALAARSRWGRSLTEERDRRVSAASESTPRTLQALRGHATRALLDELRPVLKDIITSRTRRPRRRTR
jgi:hypothetical protein